MSIGRAHKVLDAGALEDWANSFHPDVLREWQFSDALDWGLDFWDYLEQEYPDILAEFEKQFDAKNVGVGVH